MKAPSPGGEGGCRKRIRGTKARGEGTKEGDSRGEGGEGGTVGGVGEWRGKLPGVYGLIREETNSVLKKRDEKLIMKPKEESKDGFYIFNFDY